MPRFRTVFATTVALCVTVTLPASAQQPTTPTPPAAPPAAAAAPAALSPADVAAFLGDWTLNVESPMGPSMVALSIKADGTKVAGEISSEQMPKTPIVDITKSGEALVLRYDFSYEGNPVPVVVTLSPAGQRIDANLDFAGGAFVMNGIATKATAAK